MNKEKVKNRRYNNIDLFAGLAMLFIMFYHFSYDLRYIFNQDISFYPSKWMEYLRIVSVFVFMTISGMTLHFSKRYVSKVIKLGIVAVIITVTTYLMNSKEYIVFGIIHFFAFATLIMVFLQLILQYINGYFGFFISMFGFYVFWPITNGYLNWPMGNIELPRYLYNAKYLFFLGFPSQSFKSTDYYPILPWIFLLIGGYFLGKIYLSHKPKKAKKSYNPITFIGRNRLVFYIIHQPIMYIALSYYFKRSLI
ncbi:MAG: heparan-alpha-glucosaminide N-acetyltransferase domain-containing protein [Lagierella massiliensis]|nr:heparan-alpha-glucosaminide N-acetyltransferase domain-containing protein [Lagierella massiliensis]